MNNFFVDENSKNGNTYQITGADYNHIANVLRMKKGDTFLISDNGQSHLCRIDDISCECVTAEIIEENYQNTQLPVKIYLFQGLPKSDKIELIIQKCVELGVHSVIPVEMSRCVVTLDNKKKQSKVSRWQSIAESAAKQSKCSIVPEIGQVMTYKQALQKASGLDLILVPYENERGMAATKDALNKIQSGMSVGIFIGPEGGFDEKEITLADEAGGLRISLGKRILRTETAAITAVGMCMLHIEMNVDGDNV